MDFEALIKMSRRYGADEDYVLAGGGNTSYKEGGVLYIKSPGSQLADIGPEQFIAMDIRMLREMAQPQDRDIAVPGRGEQRQGVESVIHALFLYKYVLHVHPALINGLTCGIKGESACHKLFGEEAVWIGLEKPGPVLAQVCRQSFEEYTERTGRFPQIVLMQNHGIFISADTTGEIETLMEYVTGKIRECLTEKPDFSALEFDRRLVCSISPALRMLFGPNGEASVLFCVNRQVLDLVSGAESFHQVMSPFTTDQIVYCKDEPLYIEPDAHLGAEFSSYFVRKGYKPGIVAVRGLGVFALGKTRKEADQARKMFLDAVKIAVCAKSFGGANPLPDDFSSFILNREAEQYRAWTSSGGAGGFDTRGRLGSRIAIVTGGAQGFGKGIAEALAAGGAGVAVADQNFDSAMECAAMINAAYGSYRAVAVQADVTDEESVERMIQETVLAFGGLDVLISNTGVQVPGGLSEMTKENFEKMTGVNCTGYFLCVKYASETMRIQNRYAPGYLMDIIEINSNSNLEDISKNFAYAGSEFGGIGLTRSFALELAPYGIKVNAVCPGNLPDGPSRTDLEKEQFRQYLDSGNVEGAKTIDDVKKFFEAKIPLKRGCRIGDVARAVIYVIEQEYETGQAVPVTGGRIMLR